MAYRSWKYSGKDHLIAEQQYSHVPRVLILDGISRRVYEDLHLDEFKEQIADNLWTEDTSNQIVEEAVTVTQSPRKDLDDLHVISLLIMIDEFTEETHPLRHSNSYRHLKKKFNL